MDEALIKDAKNDIDRDQGSEDQKRLVRERIVKRSCGALEIRLQAGREVHVLNYFFNVGDCGSEGGLRREIERDCYRRKLALMVDRERLRCVRNLCEGAEWKCVCADR